MSLSSCLPFRSALLAHLLASGDFDQLLDERFAAVIRGRQGLRWRGRVVVCHGDRERGEDANRHSSASIVSSDPWGEERTDDFVLIYIGNIEMVSR